MIYIPTLTSKLRVKIEDNYENVLYSPNQKLNISVKGNNLTIWDNYTFYLMKRLHNKKVAYNHYLWLIDFIVNNYEEGITLITPDVDWLKNGIQIEKLWNEKCSKYPQLYVPNSWKTSTKNLNIVGYALRKNQITINHLNWVHCLGHKRDDINSKLITYDSISEIF
jgi:hypothetical protein